MKTKHLSPLILSVLLLACGGCTREATGQSTTPSGSVSRPEVESIIKDYLLKNPGVVQEALQALQRQEAERKAGLGLAALKSNRAALYQDSTAPVFGNPRGDVSIVEFFDFRCGYCRQVDASVAELIAADPNVRVVMKQFPVLGAESIYGAKAAMAAHRQGKYREFHKALMAAETIDAASVRAIAKQLQLDAPRLVSDMELADVTKTIDDNYKLAAELEVNGTPAFVIGNRIVPGAINGAALIAMVQVERASGGNGVRSAQGDEVPTAKK
jgi:protein-disulfide isomerase